MPKNLVLKLVTFTVLPVAIYSFQNFSPSPIGGTAFWLFIKAIIIVILIAGRIIFFEKENKKNLIFIDLFLIWIIFSLIRGIFMAENYWDYKTLVGRTFELLLIFIAYIASNKKILQSLLSFYIKIALPLSLIIVTYQGIFRAKGLFLHPISFIILLLPVLKKQWQIVLILLSVLVILDGIIDGTRSFILKFGIPLIILLIYYLRFFIATNNIIKNTRFIFIIAPWIFFFLGLSGIFNIFKIDQYLKLNYVAETTTQEGIVKRQDITDDSRTFIYREVLHSAQKYNYWILGRSLSRGNETVAFAEFFEEFSGKNERYKNEANVPNIFTWMGLIGLLFYFLIFFKASYLAINKSKNIYIKLIGLFLAFRWAYAWVEDFTSFGINDYTIWLIIGICSSQSFRKMNNLEVKMWARGIFEKKYTKISQYLQNYSSPDYA